MWLACFSVSIGIVAFVAIVSAIVGRTKTAKKHKFSVFKAVFASVFVATVVMFLPIHASSAGDGVSGFWQLIALSFFNSMQVFSIDCGFDLVQDAMQNCNPEWLDSAYQVWAATIFVVAPILTFGFVLSLFKNLSAAVKYICVYFKDVYVFSELNQRSLALASDIKSRNKKAQIVFTDVFESNEEEAYELAEEARKIDAICFKKDILVVNFKRHSPKRAIYFFAIGTNETENLNQSLKLIESYKNRENTHVYVFSIKIESELLLNCLDKGKVKVRRVNEVLSLVNRVLYDNGDMIFKSAREMPDGSKRISAVVIGLGNHGTEMVKALTWFGQMDGYSLKINAFDRNPLAEKKFIALAPELMSPEYNGVIVEGEAQYEISVRGDIDVETVTFAEEIAKIDDATYVLVALGNDDININTAVTLRMYFERMKIHPIIQAIVYNTQQKKALDGLKNYRGQVYDIDFIGDMESSYTEDVIIDSELEDAALQRHLKWGTEEEFWTYEYNYRSSMASAIHMKARIACGIPGADKREDELTEEERDIIETLEHRRWNAYMRAEGYVYSKSKDKASRNDLAKMHHNLVDFSSLGDEDKRKDSSVGTK